MLPHVSVMARIVGIGVGSSIYHDVITDDGRHARVMVDLQNPSALGERVALMDDGMGLLIHPASLRI